MRQDDPAFLNRQTVQYRPAANDKSLDDEVEPRQPAHGKKNILPGRRNRLIGVTEPPLHPVLSGAHSLESVETVELRRKLSQVDPGAGIGGVRLEFEREGVVVSPGLVDVADVQLDHRLRSKHQLARDLLEYRVLLDAVGKTCQPSNQGHL